MRGVMMGNWTALAKADGGRVALLLTLTALTIPAAFLINGAVPNAYMDEEFHIRQVQHYCRGEFEHWDPMITTFPGLYILSLAYIRGLLPIGQVLGFKSTMNELCEPVVLRSMNVFFCLICALVFREVILHLDPQKRQVSASVKAVVLSLYPLHWFFNFLYYTEMTSATAVTTMYLASLKRAYWISALFGAISVLLRQTNVVWVIFVLCIGLLDFIENDPDWRSTTWFENDNSAHIGKAGRLPAAEGENVLKSPNQENLKMDGVRKRQPSKEKRMSSTVSEYSDPMVSANLLISDNQGIFSEVWALIKCAWRRRYEVLWNFGPLLLVFIAFLGFVLHNGSIVVGDKSSHKVSPHFAQLFYCGLITTGFQAALHFSPENLRHLVWVLKNSSRQSSIACCIIMFVIIFISVQFFSSAHPYLLADNRHYVFYFWKDVLQKHWSSKYLFIPLYAFSWWSILTNLGRRQKVLWVTALSLAIAGVLVPTPLLEFRYYNVPFYFIFVHSYQKASNEKYTLALMALQFVAVNIVSVYIFLFWPFTWPTEPGKLQRFMW